MGNKINETAIEVAKNHAAMTKVKQMTDTSLDPKILVRVQGRINRSLIVPQVNSPATMSAATTVEKITTRKYRNDS
ncbi:hypothetical protein D3C73_1408860 [compost metagenome]